MGNTIFILVYCWGLGIWGFIDLFTLSGKVEKHNAEIYLKIEKIEKREREDDQARQLAMISAVKGS